MINLSKIPETLQRPFKTDFNHFFFYKRIKNKVSLEPFSFTQAQVIEVINSYNFNNYINFKEYSINFNQVFINQYNQLLRQKLKNILLLTELRVEHILKITERIADIKFFFSENLENSLNVIVSVENIEHEFLDIYMFTNQSEWKEVCKKDSVEFKEIR